MDKGDILLGMIPAGRRNAATAQSLADILGWDVRHVRAEIERLRGGGVPICAATSEEAGYFMPESDSEMRSYAKQFEGRIKRMQKSAQVFIKWLEENST